MQHLQTGTGVNDLGVISKPFLGLAVVLMSTPGQRGLAGGWAFACTQEEASGKSFG